ELFGEFRIDAKLVKIETGEIIKSEGLNGKKEAFASLEKQLVVRIMDGLEVKFSDKEKENYLIDGILDWEQVKNYSEAVDLYDNNKKEEAKEKILKVIDS